MKNFLKLVSETKKSTIHEKMAWRKENKEWLRKSVKIALRVLDVMSEKQITQKDLADLLQVAPQRVYTILKGEENFTLDTIVKLEKALQIEIIEVVKAEIITFEADVFETLPITKKSKKATITNSEKVSRETKIKTRKEYKQEELPELDCAA